MKSIKAGSQIEFILHGNIEKIRNTPKDIRAASRARMMSVKANLYKSDLPLKLDETRIQAKVNEYLLPNYNSLVDRLVQRQQRHFSRSARNKKLTPYLDCNQMISPRQLSKVESSPDYLHPDRPDSS